MNELKKIVAKRALDYVEDGMVLGIGSGSTVEFFVRELGTVIKEEKLDILGVPTSIDTMLKMRENGVPIISPVEVDGIDLAVDGADSVFPDKKILVKGGGGAFVREKIIDYWAEKLIIIVDYSKINREFPVPIEVIEYAMSYVKKRLEDLYGEVIFRDCKGKVGPCISDNGNIILDLKLPLDKLSREMEIEINSIPGIIDNGIFSKSCEVLVVNKEGEIRIINL